MELTISTAARDVLVDITEKVETAVQSSGYTGDGMLHVYVPHTTAGVTINEGADPAVIRDILAALARAVPRDAGYHHIEGNSDAHIKTSLIGNMVAVPVHQGRLRLGTWQHIYLAEFDGPRTRRVWLSLSPTVPPDTQ